MYDLGRMEILDAPQNLIEEHLDVVGGQMLRGHDDLVEIRLHQLCYEVDLLEKVDVRRLRK